ncbi:hsp70-Hsp90 organizing protein 1-like [Ctenocephalides felis]|uniref:hsp70-Hsp90 organizing protein 1-like n=1 Tax=Ctenocephalides felis TaxID=7515 RepID=UPI000E6E32A1|nr:hsp70-Hsp90 organizing protein 1-like [Ctenocephalides felis]
MASGENETCEQLKLKGNECTKAGKFEEAILHYTHALKLDSDNYSLYSNRSYAFLKIQQHYLALQDAEETIKRAPTWAKGYFRRAEVQYACYLFAEALLSYTQALQLQPGDSTLLDAVNRAAKSDENEMKVDARAPWLGALIGVIVGILIVIADSVLTNKPSLKNPLLMILVMFAISALGYVIARGIRVYIKSQRNSLLQPPPDLLAEMNSVEEETTNVSNSTERNNTRYTKAQARQRYKKGKS